MLQFLNKTIIFKEINSETSAFPQRLPRLHLQNSRNSSKCFGCSQFKKHFISVQFTSSEYCNRELLTHRYELKKTSVWNLLTQSSKAREILFSHLLFTHTLHYTSSQAVETCSLKTSTSSSICVQKLISRWSQITARNVGYSNHAAGLSFCCFQFQTFYLKTLNLGRKMSSANRRELLQFRNIPEDVTRFRDSSGHELKEQAAMF